MRRLTLLALLMAAPALADAQSFRAEIIATQSATVVLQRHCTVPGAKITAEQVKRKPKPTPPAIHAALALQPGETTRYRRVKLKCADTLFSEADNWYVPQRLTPAMNQALETSTTPFGRVIAPLEPKRQTLSLRDRQGRKFLTVSALMMAGNGQPLAAVVETYRRAVLTQTR